MSNKYYTFLVKTSQNNSQEHSNNQINNSKIYNNLNFCNKNNTTLCQDDLHNAAQCP